MAENIIMEEREELMVSPKHRNPTRKLAHFLNPTTFSTTIKKPISLNPRSLPKNPLKVSFNGFKTLQNGWKDWVNHMHALHKQTWQKAGIYNAVLNSSYEILKNNDLILWFAQKWCQENKTFVFEWGEVSITLEDMMVFGGYSVLGQSVVVNIENDDSKRAVAKLYKGMTELNRSRKKKACQWAWIKKFKKSGSEIEHEAFLALWLSRYVFPSSNDVVVRNVCPIAVSLARGIRLALAPAVLASIYRDLGFLRNKIGVDHNDELNVVVWAPLQLFQVWILERFLKISPNWVASSNPRFARWEKKKLSAENVAAIVDGGLEDFCWQTDANVYQEKVRSVDVVGECLDEELESWVCCIRVSELVGIDGKCIEQYLPHRVARQFGLNQDVPSDVPRANLNHQQAWKIYNRPIEDVKLYIPSQHSESCVTVRYFEWWNNSNGEGSLQSPIGDSETEKFDKDDSRTAGSKDCMGDVDVDTLGFLELEGRISKLEEVFAYLKAKKNCATC